MIEKLKFGKKYTLYRKDGEEIIEYDAWLAEIIHYRQFGETSTKHAVRFYVAEKECVPFGFAVLVNLTSRPTSLPSGYIVVGSDENPYKCLLATFDRTILE